MTGAILTEAAGGKGANQALAARRLGANVSFVGRVGADERAGLALAHLRADGVDVSHVTVDSEEPTGVAAVAVAASGENQIVVASGANARVRGDAVRQATRDAVQTSRHGVLCQLEVPDDAIAAAAEIDSALFCINAAPARQLPPDVWAQADIVIVNEVEHAALAAELRSFKGLLATTLGAAGAVLTREGAELARSAVPSVTVVDTTGAGDAFCGALIVGLLEGRPPASALTRACAAGSLATMRQGAQAALPSRSELDEVCA